MAYNSRRYDHKGTHMIKRFIVVCCFCSFVSGQVSQKETCKNFMPSVVRIDTPADTLGSGFIVSSDGWILTVAHILFDPKTDRQISTLTVHLPDGSMAIPKVFIDEESVKRDFAVLKVEKENLAPLVLGTESEIVPGSDVAIIGYPFSAGIEGIMPTKFCLFGIISATDTVAKDGVNVDAIYFQGPAIKGLSGAPIIARDTGHVIGIQTAKLAGIGKFLDDSRKTLDSISGPNRTGVIQMGGTDLGGTLRELIETLDRHLANGLGAATGIDDPKYALSKARQGKKRLH
jgi:S1-C subfamily serine protease